VVFALFAFICELLCNKHKPPQQKLIETETCSTSETTFNNQDSPNDEKVTEQQVVITEEFNDRPQTEIFQLILEIDNDSEEPTERSTTFTTMAEVHSHAQNQVASQSNINENMNSFTKRQQSCVFGDSLEDITMIE